MPIGSAPHPPDAGRGRRGRARAALALSLATLLSLAGPPATANPLTETPGAEAPRGRDARDPARDEAREEAAEARAANPSATAIIRSLAPFADGNPGAAPVAVSPGDGGPPVRVVAARAVDLTVFFAYDSARLTPEARVQVEPLGQALRSGDLSRHGFLIAGHTDAAGEGGYNRRLSLARARAVKAHLVEVYGIDPSRLRVHGWGRDRLKDPGAPLSRINRRVEVSLLAPAAWLELVPYAAPACAALADPRISVALDLDDFDAAPTPTCAD